jgi:putative endonuclease
MINKQPAVYILASKKNGTLYTGVTSDLIQRVWQHQQNLIDGFTKKYHVHQLVYFKVFEDMHNAITREKQIKAGSRANKIKLIETQNPQWLDLYPSII